jgi:hypothetical protein
MAEERNRDAEDLIGRDTDERIRGRATDEDEFDDVTEDQDEDVDDDENDMV